MRTRIKWKLTLNSMPYEYDMPLLVARQNIWSHIHDMLDERRRETFIKGKLKNQRYLGTKVDRAALEALLDRRVDLDGPAPCRTVDGTGFQPGPICKG